MCERNVCKRWTGCLLQAPNWGPGQGPGLCPDWELNWWPFRSQAGTQSIEPHQPRLQMVFIHSCWEMRNWSQQKTSWSLTFTYFTSPIFYLYRARRPVAGDYGVYLTSNDWAFPHYWISSHPSLSPQVSPPNPCPRIPEPRQREWEVGRQEGLSYLSTEQKEEPFGSQAGTQSTEPHQPGLQRAFTAFQSQSLFLKAFCWYPESRCVSLRHDAPIKLWVNKTTIGN